MITVGTLAPPLAPGLWDGVVLPLLGPAIERDGGYEPVDVLQQILRGELDLWLVEDDGEPVAAAVTQVFSEPRRRGLMICYMGGHGMAEWLDPLVEGIVGFARTAGCRVVSAIGRAGWTRVAARHGFRERARIIELEVPTDGEAGTDADADVDDLAMAAAAVLH